MHFKFEDTSGLKEWETVHQENTGENGTGVTLSDKGDSGPRAIGRNGCVG